MADENGAALLEIPKGFAVDRRDDGSLHILYKTTGMGCMLLFLGVWMTGWSFGCVMLVREAFSKSPLDDPGAYFFMLPFLAGEVAVGLILLWFLFGRTEYMLSADGLTMRKRLLFWQKTETWALDEIRGFTQVKDGGEGEDSFPSWGLQLDAEKEVKLLSRQEPEKSRWLGQLFAQWSGKPFHPCTTDEDKDGLDDLPGEDEGDWEEV